MHKSHQLELFPRPLIFKWLLMAFVAGNINAGGYLACHRFVTHVTGFATLFGIEVGSGNWATALGILSVPFYFLIGVMVSAYFTDREIARGGLPRYGIVMKLIALLLAAATVGGCLNVFGKFGKPFDMDSDYFLLVLLCGASGLQNAAITTASGGLMRSTHLTGATTDIGIGLVRSLFGHRDPALRRRDLYRGTLRFGCIAAFAVGGIFGAILFDQVEYLGFLLPLGVSLYVGKLGVRTVAAEVAAAAAAAAMPPTPAAEVSDAPHAS